MNKMLKQNSCIHFSTFIKYHWKRCNQCIKLLSSQAQTQPEFTEGPWSLYSQKVSSGVLSKNEHQEIVAQHLQQVYQEVVVFERPVLQTGGSFFSFFRKNEPQKILAPKGLYIYGSVGGGKTMLMDLFYETVPVSKTFDKNISHNLKKYCDNGTEAQLQLRPLPSMPTRVKI